MTTHLSNVQQRQNVRAHGQQHTAIQITRTTVATPAEIRPPHQSPKYSKLPATMWESPHHQIRKQQRLNPPPGVVGVAGVGVVGVGVVGVGAVGVVGVGVVGVGGVVVGVGVGGVVVGGVHG